jgi:hypothetical protein
MTEHEAIQCISKMLGLLSPGADLEDVVQAVRQRVVPDRFTLIAYKPDNVDVCMGCSMEHWSSDLIQEENLTLEQLEEKLFLLGIQKYDRYEHQHDVVLVAPHYEMPGDWRSSLDARVKIRVQLELEAEKKHQELLAKEQKEKQDLLQEKIDREIYERFKAKFGA